MIKHNFKILNRPLSSSGLRLRTWLPMVFLAACAGPQTQPTPDEPRIAGPLDSLTSRAAAWFQLDTEESAAEKVQRVQAESRADLWQRMRDGFALAAPADAEAVAEARSWYLEHDAFLGHAEQRAALYMYHVVEELEQRNMPLELALLPIVESAYDPFAYSPSLAAGMWQFTAGTAEHYGLEQNWWYDGRRDVVESTRAALDYLGELERHYAGDWLLALAAYNCGQGCVDRAIERNHKAGKATDFWSLALPSHTREYVPKLLALAQIVAAPDDWGVQLVAIPDRPYFQVVDPGYRINLQEVARLTGVPLQQFRQLNPGYTRTDTGPRGPHRILLPAGYHEQLDALASNDSSSETGNVRHSRQHTVVKGETLPKIAREYDVTVEQLRNWNDLEPRQRIRAGDRLALGPEFASTGSDTAQDARKLTYQVRRGDTLYRIAERFNVTVADVAAWNNINPEHLLRLGQQLTLYVNLARSN